MAPARRRIATYGERAVDVFYVKDLFGLKVTGDSKLERIRERLLEALQDPAARPRKPARGDAGGAKASPQAAE